MSATFTKTTLAISALASLVMMSGSANAGATISDKRYWPSEASPSAYRAVGALHGPRDAYAALGRAALSAQTIAPVEAQASHYVGGPKSSIAPSPEF